MFSSNPTHIRDVLPPQPIKYTIILPGFRCLWCGTKGRIAPPSGRLSDPHPFSSSWREPDVTFKPGQMARPQLTAFFTSSAILASPAAVNSVSAKAVGHRGPSSRFAASLKPNVAYLVLNFCALWKKQTTLPSLAYVGIPYQSFGERTGALAWMIAWSRSAKVRSDSGISAIFASTALFPASPALARGYIRLGPRWVR